MLLRRINIGTVATIHIRTPTCLKLWLMNVGKALHEGMANLRKNEK